MIKSKRCAIIIFVIIFIFLLGCQTELSENETQLPDASIDDSAEDKEPHLSLIERARNCMANNDCEGAIKLYWEVIGMYPANAEAYIELSEVYLLQNQKIKALEVLEIAVNTLDSSNTQAAETVLTQWWNTMMYSNEEKARDLSRTEILQLSDLAYLVGGLDCYVSAKGLSKAAMLSPMGIYYDTVLGYDDEIGTYFNPLLPYPVDFVTAEEHAVISADNANRFVNDVLGVDIPDLYDDWGDENYISCRDGMYYDRLGDYVNYLLYVEGYKYLGDDMYYVIFGQDWRGSPGNIEEGGRFVPDATHLIVRRSGSAWGFTVVSKLKDTYNGSALIKEVWTMPNDLITLKKDYLGNDCINAASLENSDMLGWNTTAYSDQYTYSDYIEQFIPQAFNRRLYLQDLCARYVPHADELYQNDLERKSLEQLHKEISTSSIATEYVEENLSFIKQYIDKQANIYGTLIGRNTKIDLDKDGVKETLSVSKSPSRLVEVWKDEQVQFYSFSIKVDGDAMRSFDYEDANFYFLDIETCGVLVIQPLGFNEGYGEEYGYTYKYPGMVYQYINGHFRYLGDIQGNVDLALGHGRFTTIGEPDMSPSNNGPTYEVAREYFVENGKLYHVLHTWQLSRSLWKLSKGLPLYEDMSEKISTKTIPANSMVLVISYSPDGWLYLVSDNNISGYIKMTLDSDGYWDAYPYAMPGGEPMEHYFEGYGGVAG